MRSQPVIAFSVLFGLLTVTAAPAQLNNRTAKDLFQNRYDLLNRSIETKDTKALGTLLADDYSAGDYAHLMGKAQTIDSIRRFDGSAKVKQRAVLNVIVNGKKATAIVDMVTEKHIADVKRDHVYVISTKSMDTWVLNASWQLKHSQIIRQAITKDGKKLPQRHLGG